MSEATEAQIIAYIDSKGGKTDALDIMTFMRYKHKVKDNETRVLLVSMLLACKLWMVTRPIYQTAQPPPNFKPVYGDEWEPEPIDDTPDEPDDEWEDYDDWSK